MLFHFPWEWCEKENFTRALLFEESPVNDRVALGWAGRSHYTMDAHSTMFHIWLASMKGVGQTKCYVTSYIDVDVKLVLSLSQKSQCVTPATKAGHWPQQSQCLPMILYCWFNYRCHDCCHLTLMVQRCNQWLSKVLLIHLPTAECLCPRFSSSKDINEDVTLVEASTIGENNKADTGQKRLVMRKPR